MLFQEFNRFFPLAELKMHIRNGPEDCFLADMGGIALREQCPGLLQQFQRTPEVFGLILPETVRLINCRTCVYHLERMRIPAQRPFGLRGGCRIHRLEVYAQPVHNGIRPVILYPVSQQRVHGNVKQVRHLHDQPQLRRRKLCFPFVHRADRHAQRFRQLLLRHPPLFAEHADIPGKRLFHPQVLLFPVLLLLYGTGGRNERHFPYG